MAEVAGLRDVAYQETAIAEAAVRARMEGVRHSMACSRQGIGESPVKVQPWSRDAIAADAEYQKN